MDSGRLRWQAALLAAILLAFAVFAASLLDRRLTSGDVYPRFSSLKRDPDGARALYEGLEGLPGARVRRNYGPIERLDLGPHATLLLLGTEPRGFDPTDRQLLERLETQVRSGSRLVLALAPAGKVWKEPSPTATPAAGREGRPRRRPTVAPVEAADRSVVSLGQRWGFRLEMDDTLSAPVEATSAPTPDAPALPRSVTWISGSTFAVVDPAWRVRYVRADKPVLIERPFGRGTIVLSADSTFATNAALKTARRPELFAWLVGDKSDIVFDETHLGVSEEEGIAALARRYRLEGLLAGLLVLALLFVWRGALAFAPRPEAARAATAAVVGRRSSEGLAAVLRRHVAAVDLPRICFDEWKKAFGRSRPAAIRELSRITADKDPVSAYRRSSALLKEKKHP